MSEAGLVHSFHIFKTIEPIKSLFAGRSVKFDKAHFLLKFPWICVSETPLASVSRKVKKINSLLNFFCKKLGAFGKVGPSLFL